MYRWDHGDWPWAGTPRVKKDKDLLQCHAKPCLTLGQKLSAPMCTYAQYKNSTAEPEGELMKALQGKMESH